MIKINIYIKICMKVTKLISRLYGMKIELRLNKLLGNYMATSIYIQD